MDFKDSKLFTSLKQFFLPLCAAAGLMTISCAREENPHSEDMPGTSPLTMTASPEAVPGLVAVKFTKAPADVNDIPSALAGLGDFGMRRIFLPSGRFEKRHAEAGLDRWYLLDLGEETPLTKAGNSILDMDGIEAVDFVYPIKINSLSNPNDPYFPSQWHYYNHGQRSKYVAGSDINLVPAWEITTGIPEVIVAINDGGTQYTHPDLAQNEWINEAEFNGTEGVDDDDNGYVDDIYGFNFCVESDSGEPIGTLSFEDHGTHVGGTIAAVNNNGIGLCGIAGGDGSASSGVRLMNTQCDDSQNHSAYISSSFVYAADMGALLVNCSWSIGSSTPQYISEAINYFNKYAGIDPDTGKQTGLMAGGLAIFAAGNEATNTGHPAMDENVYAVAAIGADYVISYYSNYGSWVDICAPGGDAEKGSYIFSTVTGDDYTGYQGTSMACPHVVGVAALVVSQLGGPGFTREDLISILNETANKKVLQYNSKPIGAGLVDAYAAVTWSNEPPVITASGSPDLSLSAEGSGTMSFVVTDDERQTITYSVEAASSAGLPGLDAVMEDRIIKLTVDALQADEGTYPGILTVSDQHVEVCTNFSYTIRANNPPQIITAMPDQVFSSKSESVELDIASYIGDTDGEALDYTVTIADNAVATNSISGTKLKISAKMYGSTAVDVTATDRRGAAATQHFRLLVRDGSRPYDVYPNPVSGTLYLRTGEDVTADINITNKAGASVYKGSAVAISPFSPVKIDFSGMDAGAYYVRIKTDGMDETASVIKY